MSYDRAAFELGIADRDGPTCWLQPVLRTRGMDKLALCDGRLEGHHVVPKQRIKRAHGYEEEWLNDPRNGVLVCRRHHDLLERRLVVLLDDEVPDEVTEFASDHGLGGALWYVTRGAA